MEHTLEIIGTLVGLLYLWLEYRASIYLWIASIIMPAIYIFVYYQAGLYADFGINIYYLLIAVYGWFAWKHGSGVSQELPITRVPLSKVPWLSGVFLLTFLAIVWILKSFTDSNVPWLDSFTTALSIVGMWMLARKYIEQWWVWIVVDVVSSGLYIYKELYFTAALYAIYALIVIWGYKKWKQMMPAVPTSPLPTFLPEAVILANGDFPTHPIPSKLLAHADYLVCCDGGADEYIRRGRVPHCIIGDGDSLNSRNRMKYSHLLHHVADQETNDLTKAVKYLAQNGKRKMAIVGATGKREDHTLGNISLLMEYQKQGLEVKMYTDHGVFIPCQGTHTFNSHPGQQVSIFNLTARSLHSIGLRYPIYDFSQWWQGTLNECTDTQFTIQAEGDYLVMINYL